MINNKFLLVQILLGFILLGAWGIYKLNIITISGSLVGIFWTFICIVRIINQDALEKEGEQNG
jgi:hypothetical protein